jgi:hypothetical protein
MSREEWKNMQAKLYSWAYFDDPGRKQQLEKLALAGDPVARDIINTLHFDLEKLQRVSIGRMLYQTIRRNLEHWEDGGGEGASTAGVAVGDDMVAVQCPLCVLEERREACRLSQADLRRLWEETRLLARGLRNNFGNGLSFPTLDCGRGHALTAEQIGSAQAFLQESAPCPHCTEQPPGFFSRLRCVTYFDENDSDHMGIAKCTRCGQSTSILEIFPPEVSN